MDLTRAKSILIIALILTNLLLIFSYFNKENNFESFDNAALIEHLKSKNIILQTEIPEKQNRLPVLSVKYDHLNQENLDNAIKNQTQSKKINLTEEEYIKMADNFLQECGINEKNITFDEVIQDNEVTTVKYKNVFEGYLIEDSYVNCIIQDGKVIKLDRYWLKPIEFGNSKKEIMPASDALMKFMSENEEEEEEIYIKKIELVYWVDRSVFDTESSVLDTASPTWKITYNDGKIKHIQA
ncbi:two-component system regulatory protein YycI [Anaerovorax odorimutans]|uniref:two-component system regulatory protein YycI n=1 Tax=Anaerovorax odorimutans TaxID=109327 RepID=UPI0004160B72|nr:two-component system regulatory protein YycI [Anaerovorax odorimutans]